jgi:hypothetical protein
MEIREPQRNAQGGVLHGTVSAGPYRFNIWTYPEFYEDTQGNMQPYVNPKKIVCLPENPRFAFEFGAPPQLIGRDGNVPQSGSYYVYDYMNERAATHEIHTKSAGVAVPIAVDQMYTAKVLS